MKIETNAAVAWRNLSHLLAIGIISLAVMQGEASSQGTPATSLLEFELSNEDGVPYHLVDGVLHLGGFEVDRSGSFYFYSNGSTQTLSKFDQYGAHVFSRHYSAFPGITVRALEENLLMVGFDERALTIAYLASDDGEVLSKKTIRMPFNVDHVTLLDSAIVVTHYTLDTGARNPVEETFKVIGLNGRDLGSSEGRHWIHSRTRADRDYGQELHYLGNMNGAEYYATWEEAPETYRVSWVLVCYREGSSPTYEKQWELPVVENDRQLRLSESGNPDPDWLMRNGRIFNLGTQHGRIIVQSYPAPICP